MRHVLPTALECGGLTPLWRAELAPRGAAPAGKPAPPQSGSKLPHSKALARLIGAMLLLCTMFVRAAEPDTFSPVVSYQYLDSLDQPGAQATVISPVVSYQFLDWIGDENVTFTNSAQVSFYYPTAEVATLPADTALGTSAVLRGQADALAAACVASFEWGVSPAALTNRTAGQDIGDDAALVSFSATLTGLKAGTTYFFRARKDSFGAAAPRFGETLSFTTTTAPPRTAPRVSVVGRGLANERTRTPAYFTFRRTGDLTQPLTVFFALSGTAIAGVDYDAPGTSATFAAGAASVEIAIAPRTDAIPELTEKVIVTLLASANYQLVPGASVAQRSIMDQVTDLDPVKPLPAGPQGIARMKLAEKRLGPLAESDQWFRISVAAPTMLNVSLTGRLNVVTDGDLGEHESTYASLGAHLGLQVYSATGVLATSEKPTVDFTSSGIPVIYYPAQGVRRVPLAAPGVYFIRVYHLGDPLDLQGISRSWYLVSLSGGDWWDLIEGVVPTDASGAQHNLAGEVHHVGLRPVGKTMSRVPAWIITHGRTDSWLTFPRLATALLRPAGWKRGDPTPQIFYLDWGTAAATRGISGVVSLANGYWFEKIGEQMGDLLTSYDEGGRRFSGGDVRTVGHSWGTYVNYELAQRIQAKTGAGVKKMVALDPALEATNYPQQDANFSSVSSYSLGIYSSIYGNSVTAATCEDAFDVDTGLRAISPSAKHRVAWQLFQGILSDPDAISGWFRDVLLKELPAPWAKNPADLDRVRKRKSQPAATIFDWSPDAPRFEGEINAVPGGAGYVPSKLLYHAAPP